MIFPGLLLETIEECQAIETNEAKKREGKRCIEQSINTSIRDFKKKVGKKKENGKTA